MKDKQKRNDDSALVVYTYQRGGKEFITPNQTIASQRSESGSYLIHTYTLTQEG